MTREQLFEALEDVNEKYVYEAGKKICNGRRTDTSEISEVLKETEGVVNVKIVKNKKRISLRVALIFAAVVAVFSATAVVLSGMKKDKTKYEEKKIENYFRKDDNFHIPENLLFTNTLAGYKDKFYIAADISGAEATCSTALYDMKENKRYDIELNEKYKTVTQCLTGKKHLWICAKESEEAAATALIRIDRGTFKADKTIILSDKEEYILNLSEDDNGNVNIQSYILTDGAYGDISDVYFSVYDEELQQIKKESIIDSSLIKDHIFSGVLKSEDSEDYYTFYRNSEQQLSMYKHSKDGKLLYKKEGLNDDMEGTFVFVFMSVSGNPTVATYDNRLYYFNEIDAQSGEIFQRYETDFDGKANEGQLQFGYIRQTLGKTPDKYDFTFIGSGEISGVNLADDTMETVLSFTAAPGLGDEYKNILAASAGENEILFSYCSQNDSEQGTYLFITDTDGKVLSQHNFGSETHINGIYVKNEDSIYLSTKSYESNSLTIRKTDAQGNPVSSVKIDSGIDWISDFTVSDDEKIFIYNDKEIIIIDKDGNELSRINTNTYADKIFSSQSEEYIVLTDYAGNSKISRINTEKNTIESVCTLDGWFTHVSNGNGIYDLILSQSDGLYGYDLKNNSITEIINWLDSDISIAIQSVSAANADTIMYLYYDFESFDVSERLEVIRRVDDATLQEVQNRKVISIASLSYMTESMKKLINDFNSSSDNYKIHIEDYTKYSRDGYFGSRLDEDIINGKIPDIIFAEANFDFQKYALKGAFEDLNEYIKASPEINRQDYFENVFDAYSANGKQYCLPLSFSINCLFGKKSVIGDINRISYDEFYKLGEQKNMFSHKLPYNTYLDFFINSNLSEFVDFDNRSCEFNNENFAKLLEIIKENGITEEVYNKNISTNNNAEQIKENISIIEDNSIFDLQTFGNFSSFASAQQIYIGEEASFTGLPSAHGNGAVISSQNNAAIFSSSKNKDTAWDIVKMFLTDEGQQSCIGNSPYFLSFAVKKSVYDMEVKAEKNNNQIINSSDAYGKTITLKKADQKTYDKVYNLITEASTAEIFDSRIADIVNEQAGLYFSGGTSAEEAAEAIQNKVSLYLHEIK